MLSMFNKNAKEGISVVSSNLVLKFGVDSRLPLRVTSELKLTALSIFFHYQFSYFNRQ